MLEGATVAVFERMSWGRNAIMIKIGRMPGAERVRYLDMPLIQVSSSAIRRRVREGVPIRYLVLTRWSSTWRLTSCTAGREAQGGADEVGAADPTQNSAALAERIAEIAADKKAIDIRVIDLRGIVSYTDFFVIASGNTERQAKAIHDAIYEELKHDGDERLLPRRTEGDREARWILLDYLGRGRPHLHPGRPRVLPPREPLGRSPARSVG